MLFCVIKSDFEVQVEAIFSLPPASRKKVEGTDVLTPIYLHGIRRVCFGASFMLCSILCEYFILLEEKDPSFMMLC